MTGAAGCSRPGLPGNKGQKQDRWCSAKSTLPGSRWGKDIKFPAEAWLVNNTLGRNQTLHTGFIGSPSCTWSAPEGGACSLGYRVRQRGWSKKQVAPRRAWEVGWPARSTEKRGVKAGWECPPFPVPQEGANPQCPIQNPGETKPSTACQRWVLAPSQVSFHSLLAPGTVGGYKSRLRLSWSFRLL